MVKRYLLDTSSLLSLVRYYLDFDNNKIIYNKIRDAFKNEQCILLESVMAEVSNVDDGIILKKLDFLTDKSVVIAKKNMEPNLALDIIIYSQWRRDTHSRKVNVNKAQKHAEKYVLKRTAEIKLGDFQLIFMAIGMHGKKLIIGKPIIGKPIIVTEERRVEKGGRLFKKIPLIADIHNIECITLPEMFKQIGVQIQPIQNNAKQGLVSWMSKSQK